MEMTLETGAIVNVNFKYQTPTPSTLHLEPKSNNNSSKKSATESTWANISQKVKKSILPAGTNKFEAFGDHATRDRIDYVFIE